MKYAVKLLTACLTILILFAVITGTQARGEVNVNVNIGVPVPQAVVVEEPPMMIFLSRPGVYVAVGIPYSIFFISGRYYYYNNDHWYWSHGYGDPWVHIKHKSLPPGLRRFTINQLHTYRDREFAAYRNHGTEYKGRHFVADEHYKNNKYKGHPGKGHNKHDKGRR
ncbi:MAG: hypothetical protein IT393_04735 [Nitrospirae bacterium]|nr:hypothetical protein [Nitrospirota bacterium]